MGRLSTVMGGLSPFYGSGSAIGRGHPRRRLQDGADCAAMAQTLDALAGELFVAAVAGLVIALALAHHRRRARHREQPEAERWADG